MPNIIFYVIGIAVTLYLCIRFKLVPFGMAVTTTSDIDFASPTFAPILQAELTNKTALLDAGILAPANDNIIKPDATGNHITIPSWDSILGDSDRIVTDTDPTYNKMTTFTQNAVVLQRYKAWAIEDIVKTISGADPSVELARNFGAFIAYDLQRIAISVKKGCFANADLAASHSTGATYSGAVIDVNPIIAAKLLAGDNMSRLDRCVMHSKPYGDALIKRIASPVNLNNNVYETGQITQLLGSAVSTDDGLSAVAGVYSTMFAAPGAMIYKFIKKETLNLTGAMIYDLGNNIQLELSRSQKGGGTDQITIRYSVVVHLNGMSFSSAVTNPTNAELATGANWTKVAPDNKQIRIVELKTA